MCAEEKWNIWQYGFWLWTSDGNFWGMFDAPAFPRAGTWQSVVLFAFICLCLFISHVFPFNIPDLNKKRPEGGSDCQGRKEQIGDFARLSSHPSAALICLQALVHVCAVNHMMTFLTFVFVHKRCTQARRVHPKLRGVTWSLLVASRRVNTSKMSTWLDSGHVFWETTADLFFLISRSQRWRTLRLLLV